MVVFHNATQSVLLRIFYPCISQRIVFNQKVFYASSYYLQVGDIVRVEDNEPFPCDLVMLSSSDDQGQCSITTANLDGETNLKVTALQTNNILAFRC